MLRFNWMAGLVALIGGVVLATQMQNCSGEKKRLARIPASLSAENEILQFPSEQIILESSVAEHTLSGTCLKKLDVRMKLGWDFVASDGKTISKGEGKCVDGVFEAKIKGLENLACQTPYWLKASASSSSALFETQIQILKDCPAKHRLPAVASQGRQCYFELREYASGNQCVYTCYSKNVSDEIRIVEKEKCGPSHSDQPAHNS